MLDLGSEIGDYSPLILLLAEDDFFFTDYTEKPNNSYVSVYDASWRNARLSSGEIFRRVQIGQRARVANICVAY